MTLPATALQSEFVRSLPVHLLPKLESIAQTSSVPAGTKLFTEGESHPDFHVIVSGHVRLDMLVPRRGRIPILTAGPGDVLAWSALLGNSTMTSTAIALEPVTTLNLSGQKLLSLCETDHEIGFAVMKQLAAALSRRLVATRLQLLDLFAEHVPEVDAFPHLGRPGDPEC